MATKAQSQGISDDTKLIITVLTLFLFYPLGIVFVWVWMKWPVWVKILLSSLLLLLLVLPVLLAIVLIVINPSRQFSQSNNTKRSSDVSALLNAVTQYRADHNNALPPGLTSIPMTLSTSGVNLCSELRPVYIAAIPVDPSINEGTPITDCSRSYDTGYSMVVDDMGRVTVRAEHAELDAEISATE